MGRAGELCKLLFADELSLISDGDIRTFVVRVFDALCPETFWVRPASSSGKFHPELSSGEGGLVRHVKYACWWGQAWARSLDGEGGRNDKGENLDVIIASLIMHDILKDGDPTKSHLSERIGKQGYSLISGCHGVDLCLAIWERVLNQKVEQPWQMLIMYAVAGHMGVWTIPAEYRPSNIQGKLCRKIAQIVHIADMAAAQKVEEPLAKIGGVLRTGVPMITLPAT